MTGEPHICFYAGWPLCLADGAPQWMFGMQVDITKRKRQEEALRRNEAFLQRIGELAGIGRRALRTRLPAAPVRAGP